LQGVQLETKLGHIAGLRPYISAYNINNITYCMLQ